MGIRERMQASLAAQLRRPHGLPGRFVGRMLGRANRAAIIEAVEAMDIPPAAELADLGFGGGLGLELLMRRLEEGGHVYGVDQSETMIAAAAHRFRREIRAGVLTLQNAPIEHLPLATGTLDGAITLNTLYFIPDLAAALDECARVLRPSGQLVIGLGDPQNMARNPLTAHGFLVRSLDEITSALRAAHLEVDKHVLVGTGERAFHLLVAQPY
jgi:ubiquinone/menaquinone biosynthesis C-methylase UbiE